MRKPSPDAGLPLRSPEPEPTPADTSVPPDHADAAVDAGPADEGQAATTPSLVWPPPEEELSGWEVLHLNPSGHTLIEPMKFDGGPAAPSTTPPAPSAPQAEPEAAVPLDGQAPFRAAPAEASPASDEGAAVDQHAPTRIIRVPPSIRGPRPVGTPRTPRTPLPGQAGTPAPRPAPDPDETNPGLATRIIRRPAELSRRHGHSTGRPPGARPAAVPPRRPPEGQPPAPTSMLDTLPIAIPRDRVAAGPPRQVSEPPVTSPPPASAGDVLIRPVTLPPEAAAPPPRAVDPAAAGAAPGGVTPVPARKRASSSFWRAALWMLALVVIALVSFQLVRTLRPAAAAPPEATLVVESSPAGAEVFVDGQAQGTTPFRGTLGAGEHQLEVRGANGARRTIPIVLAAGTIATHYIDLPPPPVVKTDGAIEVRSEPPGARVEIGGRVRGVTPLVVDGLEPGDHRVRVSGPFRAVTRTVTVTAGQQAVLVVTPAPAAEPAGEGRTGESTRKPASGYFRIQSPIVLRVVANGEFLGTSEDDRLTLPAGPHVINLENESVGFRDVRTIDVQAGRTIDVPIELPQGTININARPWAEVFVDGRRAGETPVAQLALPIGIHEILFRHPEHGERRVTAIVKVGIPARAFVDFTR